MSISHKYIFIVKKINIKFDNVDIDFYKIPDFFIKNACKI